ncbi:MAG: TadE/TadG family type IV pilus assembly protein [Candidatus Dormibacteraceae bacterium]
MQRGQSLVEFAISSIVLLLLAMGLLDFSRAFYYAVNLQGAAREGARHGAWFNTAARTNAFLDDTDIMTAVNQSLAGAGLTGVLVASGTCLAPSDGNTAGNKPYAAAAFPSTPNSVNVYICYTYPGGNPRVGTLAPTGACPGCGRTDNSWRLGDVNVALLMNFQLITPFIQNLFGNGVNLAYNEHFTIQGKP